MGIIKTLFLLKLIVIGMRELTNITKIILTNQN
jgi:hypothetical protein